MLNSISVSGEYFTVNCNLVNTMTMGDCMDILTSSKIFVSRSHGDGSNDSSLISLVPSTSSDSRYLSSVSIYNFETGRRLVDLSNVYLAIYVGCKTAYGGNGEDARNLITASVKAGAEYAVGFADKINCDDANEWTEAFFIALANGNTVEEAKTYAVTQSGISSCVLLSRSDLEE